MHLFCTCPNSLRVVKQVQGKINLVLNEIGGQNRHHVILAYTDLFPILVLRAGVGFLIPSVPNLCIPFTFNKELRSCFNFCLLVVMKWDLWKIRNI